MKNIFVTGISGMLGANIAFLLRENYRVSGIDLNEVDIENVNSTVGSVLDLDLMRKLLTENRVDVFIHCAALVNVDECELHPDYANQINSENVAQLADLCHELSVKFIFISTDAVFSGEREGYLYKESDETDPISVYGKTKLAAEQHTLQYEENLVVRTNIYGFNYRDKFSFGEWIINSLDNNQPLNMVDDIYFSPILVNELVELIDRCIREDIRGLYHVCSTGSINKYDIACCFKKTFEKNGEINRVKMADLSFKAPRTHNMGMDNEKIRKKLGVSIRTPEESVLYFKELSDKGYPARLKRGK